MYKIIYLLSLIFIIFSCREKSETLEQERMPTEIIEKNLKKDIYDYFQCLFDGNDEKGFKYLHESNIEYLKKEFPNEYNDDIPKQVLRMTSKQFKMFKDSLGADLELKVETLENKVTNENYIIYTCKSKFIVSKEKDTIKEDTFLIGISENGGNNFKFLQADDKEYLIQVLKVRFNSEIINKISN